MSTVFGCPKSYLQKQAGMILLIFDVQHIIYLKPKHLFTVQTIFIIINNLFDKHFLIQFMRITSSTLKMHLNAVPQEVHWILTN